VNEFADRLSREILVADGGLGSQIARHLPIETPGATARGLLEANLAHPEIVQSIHLEYITAGAQIIETNTFGASPARLERLGLGENAHQIISDAVKIAREAREASGQSVRIAGSMGPLDADWMLDTNPDEEEQIWQFADQSEVLLERGADLIILETFSHLGELLLAIRAVRRVSKTVPVVAQMTFDERGELASGENAETAARIVTEADKIEVLGVNCSLGPQASLAVLENLAKGTNLPLSIMPNAGFAQRHGGRVLYPDMSSRYYAEFARDAVATGARVIGGCCGTTPQQIKVIHDAVAKAVPGVRPTVEVHEHADLVEEELPGMPEGQPSGLMTKLRAGKFVRSLQVDPQRGPSDALNRELVKAVLESDVVDVVDVNSSGSGSRQDALQIAAGLERLGLETIPHITPRDSSVAGVLSQVLGAYDWGGVRNVLVIVGDPPKGDTYAEAKGVYQVDSIGLVRALDKLRQGRRVNNRVTMPPFPLSIGVALNQNAPDKEYELQRLELKIEAGADFVMTQPFFQFENWERYHTRLKQRFDIPVILGVWPLISHRQALRINENVAGVEVPESVCAKLAEAGPREAEVGFELAAELIAELRRSKTAAGVYVVAPFKQPKRALEVFQRAAELVS
jgi:homocysteine S-methyltransferase